MSGGGISHLLDLCRRALARSRRGISPSGRSVVLTAQILMSVVAAAMVALVAGGIMMWFHGTADRVLARLGARQLPALQQAQTLAAQSALLAAAGQGLAGSGGLDGGAGDQRRASLAALGLALPPLLVTLEEVQAATDRADEFAAEFGALRALALALQDQLARLSAAAAAGDPALEAGRDLAGQLARQGKMLADRLAADAHASLDQVRSDLARGQRIETAVIVIGLALAALLTWHQLGHGLTARLAALAKAGRRVAQGDRSVALEAAGHDDIADLTRTLLGFRQTLIELERRTAEARLNQEQTQQILLTAPFPIVISRLSDHRVHFANEAAGRLVGIAHTEALGRLSPQFWVRPQERQLILEEIAVAGEVRNREIELKDCHDRPFWALFSAVRFSLAEEPLLMVVVNDISRLKQSEQALRSARDQAELALAELQRTQDHLIQSEKLASLGSLVAGVAHEINTPVGVALTGASMLADQVAALRAATAESTLRRHDFERFLEDAGESSRLILANIQRAADLVQGFRQVAADQVHDERRRYDLRSYLEELVFSLGPAWRRPGHRLSVSCAAGLEIDGNPGLLSQVLTNLVMNALVHAFEPGQRGSISINVSRLEAGPGEAARIELVFADDGQGIAPELQRRVFEPFFTTRRGQGNSGLGLNIVYNLVTGKLGGQIELDSAPGHGTRFILRLPLVQPA